MNKSKEENLVPKQKEFLSIEQFTNPKTTPQDKEKYIKPHKTIRLAVSGDVFITRLETEIIDTPDFQRLRGVRQLGNVVHVYPTALHTRFDHSLGTLAMADRMVNTIKSNEHSEKEERYIEYEQIVLTRLYALLHDITHVPFGHTIEDELGLITRHDDNPERILKFLGPDSDIGKLITGLGDEIYDRFMSIFIWKEKEIWEKRKEKNANWKKLEKWKDIKEEDVFIHDIVSNTVCADLLDYIARDNYFCNLGCSMEYRFINFLYLKRENEKKRVFVRLMKKGKNEPRKDTLTDLARLIEARYLIAERVYFHHTKIISGAMLGRALYEAIIGNRLKEEDLYKHTDDTLISHLANNDDMPKTTKRLAKALIERKLYKVFRFFSEGDFAGIKVHNFNVLADKIIEARFINSNARNELENQITKEIGAEEGDVLIYAPPREMNMKWAETKIEWYGEDKILCQIADPIITPRFNQIIKAHKSLWKIYVIINPNLKEEKNKHKHCLLEEACRYHFIDALHDAQEEKNDESKKKELMYYKNVIYTHLVEKRIPIRNGEDLRNFDERLLAATKDLMTDFTYKTTDFLGALGKIIEKYFSNKPD